jgi:5,10-methylenetetrahydrofolate reductase
MSNANYTTTYQRAVTEATAELDRQAKREREAALAASEATATRLRAKGFDAVAIANGTGRRVMLNSPSAARAAALLTGGEAYHSQVDYY